MRLARTNVKWDRNKIKFILWIESKLKSEIENKRLD